MVGFCVPCVAVAVAVDVAGAVAGGVFGTFVGVAVAVLPTFEVPELLFVFCVLLSLVTFLTVTLTLTLPNFLFLPFLLISLTVIFAVPFFFPLTTPFLETVAIFFLLLVKV